MASLPGGGDPDVVKLNIATKQFEHEIGLSGAIWSRENRRVVAPFSRYGKSMFLRIFALVQGLFFIVCANHDPTGPFAAAWAVGFTREEWPPEGHQRLFPVGQGPAMVGDRYVANRRQHIGRANHRHAGFRVRDGIRDCILRMDVGNNAHHRWQVSVAGIFEAPDLHDAAVSRATS